MSRRKNRSEGRRDKGAWGGGEKERGGGEECSPRVSSGPDLLPTYTLTFPSAKTISKF